MRLENYHLVTAPVKYEGYGIHRGRVKYSRTRIDFGRADLLSEWVSKYQKLVEYGPFQSSDGDFVDIASCKYDFVLDGFFLHGVVPVDWNKQTNTCICSIDYFEEVMSHRQHYRYKDFPPRPPRMEFTTIAEFERHALTAKHIVVDAATYECLAHDFDDIKGEVWIAPNHHRKVGLVLKIGECLIFTDALLPKDRHWVNENPGSPRPQFLIVDSQLVNTKHYETHLTKAQNMSTEE